MGDYYIKDRGLRGLRPDMIVFDDLDVRDVTEHFPFSSACSVLQVQYKEWQRDKRDKKLLLLGD